PIDGATPAGASSLAEALLTAAATSAPDRAIRYRDLADRRAICLSLPLGPAGQPDGRAGVHGAGL
ncbi:hypothetical protein GV794_28525, partial [Nocardia cyriacigeorgica]